MKTRREVITALEGPLRCSLPQGHGRRWSLRTVAMSAADPEWAQSGRLGSR
jgi:hypothetical protein